MTPRNRSWVLACALVATLAAAWFAPSAADGGVALPATRAVAVTAAAPTPSASAAAGREPLLAVVARGDDAGDAPTLFAAVHPPAPAPQPAPVPVAPVEAAPAPLGPPPFKVLGRYRQGDDVVAFLQYNNENLVVREGDTVLDRYKVQKLTDDAIELRHLPGDELQTLDFGAK